jgi:hypothetical protein
VRAQLSTGGGAQNISIQQGERPLFEEIKYFFYITNHSKYRAEQMVALANKRCDQENVIEQLKNGVNAMRMPVDDLVSNWAMVQPQCYAFARDKSALEKNIHAKKIGCFGQLVLNLPFGCRDRPDFHHFPRICPDRTRSSMRQFGTRLF